MLVYVHLTICDEIWEVGTYATDYGTHFVDFEFQQLTVVYLLCSA